MKIGAHYAGDGKAEFTFWGPFLQEVSLRIISPSEQMVSMEKDEWGYWRVAADSVVPGSRYLFVLDREQQYPDPASHFQPEGVHGPSEIIDHSRFEWNDTAWEGIPLHEMIMYELHVGTFTPEGTFDAIIPRLDSLVSLGVTAVEVMPVSQFPGERNWGYDGVYHFAVQNSYGGPGGLKRLVDACHRRGIAVILDVVYNHFGPEGNYISQGGPYFTESYKTPWGAGVNFDGNYSYGVRNFFIENALYWFEHYHFDALRLDAIHAIIDMSAHPFLQELAEKVDFLSSLKGKRFFLIAESDLNDSRVVRPRMLGGYGLDAQWCDDFQHALHTLLTGEDQGYYGDYGGVEDLVTSLREGYSYSGRYSRYRKRCFGNSSADIPPQRLIVFSQNHDQVGNRMLGERISTLVDFEGLKLTAAAVLLAPYIPLLFMGEEYGEGAPFLYYVSHSDESLVEAVRVGRKAEFEAFLWEKEPPDPAGTDTFLQSKLNWSLRDEGKHRALLAYYAELIRLRKNISALSPLNGRCIDLMWSEEKRFILMRRWAEESDSRIWCAFNFGGMQQITPGDFIPEGIWIKVLDSSDQKWGGKGALLPEKMESNETLTLQALSCTVYGQQKNKHEIRTSKF